MGFDGPSGKLFVRLEDLAAFSSPLCLYAPLTVCLRLYFGFAGPVVSIFNCFTEYQLLALRFSIFVSRFAFSRGLSVLPRPVTVDCLLFSY